MSSPVHPSTPVFDNGGERFPRLEPPLAVSESMSDYLASTKFYRPGRPLRIHQLLAHHPRAGQSLNRFLDWGEDARLTSRERRLLILRTSIRTRCGYEWDVHAQVAVTNSELSDHQLEDLPRDVVSPELWTERDRLLVSLADEVCQSDTISDDLWEVASTAIDQATLIEALIVVGYYRMCGGLINAVGVPNEGALDLSS